MAAASYYASGGMPEMPQTSSPHLAPPPGPQRTASGPPHPNPSQQQNAPPPYQPFQEDKPSGVHFAPPPPELEQRHSFSHQHRPSFSNTPPPRSSLANASPRTSFSNQSPHRGSLSNPPPHRSSLSNGSPHRGSFSNQQRPPPQNINPNGMSQYPPPPPPQNYMGTNSPQMPYGTSPQQNGFLAPPPEAPRAHPYMHSNPSYGSFDTGYASDPEPRRRSHKQRSRRDSHESRAVKDIKSHSRTTNTDAFIGAAGGGLIGDLIFPGLGTIGGAALGWLGGKDYGNHRKWREDKRERDQKTWEDKHRPSRSRSRDPDGDHYYDEKGRRHRYERRHSHY